MRTFVTAAVGQMLPPGGISNSEREDRAFAELERSVDTLSGRMTELLKPGAIDHLVEDALAPLMPAITRKVEELRNSALPPHLLRTREAGARVRGAFLPPKAVD